LKQKTNNMKRNNCYECPHRREVPGSAHSACAQGVPAVLHLMIAFTTGNILAGYCDENGNAFLQFDPHGVKSGWCSWPVNFDPTWVECYLPIEKTNE